MFPKSLQSNFTRHSSSTVKTCTGQQALDGLVMFIICFKV